MTPEQKVKIVEEDSETSGLQTEESGTFVGDDDVSMNEVYSSPLTVPVSTLSFLSLSHTPTHTHTHTLLFPFVLCSPAA